MRRLVAALGCVLAINTYALEPNQRVDNFELIDHQGKAHELSYYSDMDAVVLMVQGNGCPIVRNALPEFQKIVDSYQGKNVAFMLINSNFQDNRNNIAAEAKEFGYQLPILVDDTQLVGESLGFERTGEVFVINPKDWTLAYRGAINDRLGYETQKVAATEHYMEDAINALIAGEEVKLAQTVAKGCIINMVEADNREAHKQISYSEEIAPMLIDKCVTCHHDGGIGPFAMNSYAMVKGFAPMIREVIRTKRMPPWHADPHFGEFTNDRSLSAEEQKTLVHWIEAGALRGDGPDTLAEHKVEFPEWSLGKPDAIIEIPGYDVPATGVVDYQYVNVKNTLGRDVWVKGVQILPGSRQALHHVITTVGYEDPEARGGFRTLGGMGGYVPGGVGEEYPENTGIFLPKDASFQFQMHYTTFGKAVRDESRLGIYFHDEAPKYPLEARVLANPAFKIPAGAKDYQRNAKWQVPKDIALYTLLPHSHFRGKASDFIATYPDGREEVLLSVPNYDFNWQTTYFLEEPKVIPAGTVITHHTSWDNSAQNPHNPDPTVDVTWGEQSWEEMLFGSIKYRELTDEE